MLPLAGCGSSIQSSQDFKPNKAPVFEGFTATDSNGVQIQRDQIVQGTKIHLTIKAYDPEKGELIYTLTPNAGSIQNQTITADGCDADLWTETVTSDAPVTVGLSIKDIKGASATTVLDIGTGKTGAVLSMGAIDKSTISSDSSASFSFTSTGDGLYQLIESETKPTTVNARSRFYQYGVNIEKTADVIVGGAYFTGENKLILSAGEGTKKIWVIFQDLNYSTAIEGMNVTIKDGPPSIVSTTPADKAQGIGTSTTFTAVFNKTLDSTTVTDALSISGATVSFISYDKTLFKATYSVSGLTLGQSYTAIISGIKDTMGQAMASYSIAFDAFYTRTITFNTDGGTVIPAQYIKDGLKVTKPSDPAKKYFNFGSWYTDSSFTTAWDFTNGTVSQDMTLYSKWNNVYNIGDIGPTGGYIFYINPNYAADGYRYKEMSNEERTSTSTSDGNGYITKLTWYDHIVYFGTTYGPASTPSEYSTPNSSWRLPTADEMYLIYNIRSIPTSPTIDLSGFYWSGDTDGGNSAAAVVMDFDNTTATKTTTMNKGEYYTKVHARGVRNF